MLLVCYNVCVYYTVYKITNIINNKIYIGFHSTNNLNDKYMGSGVLIKKSIKKYGIENFEKEILFVFDDKKLALKKEIELIEKLDTKYNLTRGGEGINGYFHTEETKRKIGDSLKGEKHPQFGKSPSEETKQKMSESHMGNKRRLGIPHSEESKKRISEANKGRLIIGRTLSEETKRKISESLKGRKLTEEHKIKLRKPKQRKNVKIF